MPATIWRIQWFLKLFACFTSLCCSFSIFMFSPPLFFTVRFLHSLSVCPESRGRTHMNFLCIYKEAPSKGKKRSGWNGHGCWQNCAADTENMTAQPPATPLPLALLFLFFCQYPPPPPFLFFPWNPFHIIKDTQMKWTLRKSGFQQGGCGGGGGWEAASWECGIGSSRSTPPHCLPHSLPHGSPLDGSPPWSKAEWLWPQYGSISSPLLISKAHYFVLRLALGQGSSRALSWPTAASFLPLHPTLAGHLPGP